MLPLQVVKHVIIHKPSSMHDALDRWHGAPQLCQASNHLVHGTDVDLADVDLNAVPGCQLIEDRCSIFLRLPAARKQRQMTSTLVCHPTCKTEPQGPSSAAQHVCLFSLEVCLWQHTLDVRRHFCQPSNVQICTALPIVPCYNLRLCGTLPLCAHGLQDVHHPCNALLAGVQIQAPNGQTWALQPHTASQAPQASVFWHIGTLQVLQARCLRVLQEEPNLWRRLSCPLHSDVKPDQPLQDLDSSIQDIHWCHLWGSYKDDFRKCGQLLRFLGQGVHVSVLLAKLFL
mmetsp:Transcript_83201/g.243963  ORF Transcript_83201/g.243963 Transcript_83201/m.243963 type:complete len:286 (+) Transcript_83201:86-943(+)